MVDEFGSIIFNGINLLGLRKEERERFMGSKIDMIFQNPMNSLRPTEKVSKQFIETLKVAESRGNIKLEAYDYSMISNSKANPLLDRFLGVKNSPVDHLTLVINIGWRLLNGLNLLGYLILRVSLKNTHFN